MCWIGQNTIATIVKTAKLNAYLWFFQIDIVYTANNILYKFYTKMAAHF